MGTLKIHDNKLDKDQWDNVPQVIYKVLKINEENMKNIKSWAATVEQRSMKNSELTAGHQGSLDQCNSDIQALKNRMDQAEGDLVNLANVGRHQALSAAGSLKRLDRCIATLFSLIGQTFGVDLTKVMGEAYLDEGEQKEGEDDENNAYEAAGKGAKEEGQGEDDKEKAEENKEETQGEAEQSEQVAAEKLPPGVAIMDSMGCGLEANLEGIEEAFARWTQWRHQESDRRESIEANIEDLRLSAERTRERILTWREMLKESSHGIDSLGQSLAKTQAAVQDLYSTRVQRHDVDNILKTKAEELEGLQRLTEKSVEKLGAHVEEHMGEVQRLIADSKRQSDEQLAEHTGKVSQMVERHMNPLNAYLNGMHVKTDVMRVELDKLGEQMPKLATGLDDLSSKLRSTQQANSGKTSEILNDVKGLSESLAQGLKKGAGQYSDLCKLLKELEEDLGQRIKSVQRSLEDTTESLESVKRDDLNGLARELMSLDQKVAKWVHAHPLPAKISEARLYSLEARLADEMDARMFFESKVRTKSMMTPRQRGSTSGSPDADALPQLDSGTSQPDSSHGSTKNSRRLRNPPPTPAE